MAPKEAKQVVVVNDVDTSKKQLVNRLSVAAQSMRQCATLVETVAQTVAKLPLDADSIEALQELLSEAPVKIGKRKSRGDDEGDGTKRKRVTKPKDPNAPKRPASAYILFQNEVRAKLKEQNPELPQSELLSLIGRRWTAMSQQEKERYTSENTKAKEKYQSAKAAYDAQAVPDVPVAADIPAPPKKTVAAKKKAKSPPKSVPMLETSSDDSEGSSEESSVEEETKAVAKEEEDDDDEDEDDLSSVASVEMPPPPPTKKAKATNVKKVKA